MLLVDKKARAHRATSLTPSFVSTHSLARQRPYCVAPEERLPGVRLRIGGEILFIVALVLLALWLLGLVGVYHIGDLFHVFLLVGLMLLLIAYLHAREPAVRRAVGDSTKAS